MAGAACRAEDPKTNTRRVMLPSPVLARVSGIPMWRVKTGPIADYFFEDTMAPDVVARLCDYKVGERRCLLTTWAVSSMYDRMKPLELACASEPVFFWHAGNGPKPDGFGKSRPGRFLPNHLRPVMPVFEVTAVRVERVQDISNEGIIAEGCRYPVSAGNRRPLLRITGNFPPYQYCERKVEDWTETDWLRAHWASLWDSINAKRGFGWDANPWVWVVEFRKLSTLNPQLSTAAGAAPAG